MEIPLGDISQCRRTRRQPKLSTLPTRLETRALLSHLNGTAWLVDSLLYGSGLRRIKAVRLRVNDITFNHLVFDR